MNRNDKRQFCFRTIVASLLALFAMTPAFAQDEESMKEKFESGVQLLQAERFDEAARIFRDITSKKEDAGMAWFYLGYALHADGQLQEAIEVHKKAAGFDEFAAKATYNLACAYSLTHERDAAIEALQKAVDAGFDDYQQCGKDTDLHYLHTDVRFAKILTELNGEDEVAAQFDTAEEYLAGQDFAKAAEIYRAVVDAHPKNAFATYRLGYSLHGAGELDAALEMHAAATKFKGVAPIATYNIACVHSLKDDKETALKHLAKAINKGFTRMDALDNDPDLENIRSTERFAELVAKVKEMNEGHSHKKTKEKVKKGSKEDH